MNPIDPHASVAERKARRQRLDTLIQASPMKVTGTMREVGRQVFAAGALSKKHKELTALAVAVATNCWE
jgi:alkylhydroperoxidase/carboxymuconolactone decarboxylase family protein YurZ